MRVRAVTAARTKDGLLMEKGTGTLASSFVDQWTRTWQMWEELIESIPDDEWTKGDVDYLLGVVVHQVQITLGFWGKSRRVFLKQDV
jgi:hypothetical protein